MTEKHAGGRPRKFKTVAQMEAEIEAYFAECDTRVIDVVTRKGDVVTVKNPAPYTVTGLALVLGIDRHTLLDYETEGRVDEFGAEFHPTIKRAKERVHANLEFRLYDGQGYGPGHIFGLKNNFAWNDKQEIEFTKPVEVIVKYDGNKRTSNPST